jgi:hypothetical protein
MQDGFVIRTQKNLKLLFHGLSGFPTVFSFPNL